MLGLAVVMLGHHNRLTDPTLAELTFATCAAGPLLRAQVGVQDAVPGVRGADEG